MKQETKFKETEIGKIPEEWEIKSISDISEIYLGGTPKTTIKEFWDGDIKWASARDVANCSGRYIYNTEKTITINGIENSAAKILPKDTIVITSRGTVGALAMLPESMAFNQTCYGLRAKEGSDVFFFYYGLKEAIARLKSVSYGTVFETITMRTFDEVKISVPTLTEQKAIAKILSDLDAKIELNLEMNKTLEAIGQALFKRWFIDFEFPVEVQSQPSSPALLPKGEGGEGKGNGECPLGYKSSGGEMVESELGEIPKGWGVGKFCNIVTNIKEALKSGNHLSDRRYVPIDSLPMKHIGMIEDKPSVEAKSSLIAFEKNDILFGAMRAYFHRVNFAPFKGITRTTTFVLRPNKEHYLNYGLFLLNQDSSVDYANLHSKGSTMPYAVWDNSLAEMPVFVPDEVTLKAYHNLIYPLLQRIAEISDENKKLSNIRNSLLPRLMSGKIRIV